jgi:hypothetical protein
MKINSVEVFYKFIPKLNALFTFSTVMLVVYLFLNIRNAYYPKMQIVEQKSLNFPVLLQDSAIYKQELFNGRQLFITFAKKSQQAKTQENERFILLGVSTGEKNLAMIKDPISNKDYYCKVGDKVEDFRVREILKNRVILESAEETLVLNR